MFYQFMRKRNPSSDKGFSQKSKVKIHVESVHEEKKLIESRIVT